MGGMNVEAPTQTAFRKKKQPQSLPHEAASLYTRTAACKQERAAMRAGGGAPWNAQDEEVEHYKHTSLVYD